MVSCKKMLQELSNYIDNSVDPNLRDQIEHHLRSCRRCSLLVNTTRKTLQIYCDASVLEVPAGYSARLRAFFAKAANG